VPPPVIEARAAVVVDGDSGAVLFDKDAHTPLPPASTTKIVTALLALERGNLDEVVEVQLDPNRTYWGSVMGLQNGDRFTLRDLLYGLMLPSGNDAAYVIAAHIGGSERAFADMMTVRMRTLGLTESSFMNASGLGRGESNLVSAHDLAQVARHAMTYPEFVKLASARSWTARGSRVIGMRNLNELVYAYPGADGVKIGWGGRTAGHTIVGSAVRGGHRVFVALLNTPDRAGESTALLDWAFASFAWDEAGAQ
jgi:D-alanyl-D-alanine carboxypeptidase (penicillin-binding protein 5/6)